jgi:hypothetical protein
MNSEENPAAAVAQWRAECEILTDEFVRIYIEDQELQFIVAPNLRRLQMITTGTWELRRLEAGVKVKRLRRKIVMIQSHVQSGEAIRLDEIDRQIEAEFAEWEQRIRTLASEVAAARQTLGNLMNDADEAEFKNLHRELVKKFHPDLAGDAGPDAQAVWDRVRDAYCRHDLRELRALSLFAQSVAPAAKKLETAELLGVEQKRLRQLVGNSLRKIAEIQKHPPFTLEKLLADNVWVEQRRDEISAEAALLSAEAAGLEIELMKLLPAINKVQQFGPN